jgi:hypothetical protein
MGSLASSAREFGWDVSRYRLTARPAMIHLADILSRELEGEGVSAVGTSEDQFRLGGWDVTGPGGEAMVLVVAAPDSAAVHRAIARVSLRLGGTATVDVTEIE